MFNFTNELIHNFDRKIKRYDDLVRLTIRVSREYVYNSVKDLPLSKVNFVREEFDSPYSSVKFNAQFTSSNRPYEITNDIEMGMLTRLHRNLNVPEKSRQELKDYILENQDQYRKHDTTVVDIVRDFHDAFGDAFLSSVSYIKDHPIFTVGSFASFKETNPHRNNLIEPYQSVRSGGNVLHVYDAAENYVYADYYASRNGVNRTEVGRVFLNDLRNSMPKIINGEENNFIRHIRQGNIFRLEGSYTQIISRGFIINGLNYTVRDDLEPSEFFAQHNSNPKNLYVILNGKIHLVPMTSVRSHESEQYQLLQIIESEDTHGCLPSRCSATGHYTTNTLRSMGRNPNSRVDLFNNAHIYMYHDFQYVTKAFADKFLSKVSFTQGERCSSCNRFGLQIDGDLDVALNLSSNQLFRNAIKRGIRDHTEQEFTHEHGGIFCSSCKARIKNMISLYNGYFSNGYFVGPDSVEEAEQVVEYDHVFIQDYDFRPMNFYDLSNSSNVPSLGVELEVDSDDDGDLSIENAATMAQMVITKGDDHAYLMNDGSLEAGFELATYPADIYQHMDPRLFDYEKAFEKLVRAGYRGHDAGSAGIHVHLSREFFGYTRSEQLYRASLMAYIMESNWEDFVKFSRRRYHHLDQWAKKKDAKHFYDMNKEKNAETMRRAFVDEYDMSKYVAFNINHSNTFELRIFRSTLNYQTYLATLQFVHNFAMLAKRINLTEAQLITFKDIVKEHEFDELTNYVKLRFGNEFLD